MWLDSRGNNVSRSGFDSGDVGLVLSAECMVMAIVLWGEACYIPCREEGARAYSDIHMLVAASLRLGLITPLGGTSLCYRA